jgi:hypothetical protein
MRLSLHCSYQSWENFCNMQHYLGNWPKTILIPKFTTGHSHELVHPSNSSTTHLPKIFPPPSLCIQSYWFPSCFLIKILYEFLIFIYILDLYTHIFRSLECPIFNKNITSCFHTNVNILCITKYAAMSLYGNNNSEITWNSVPQSDLWALLILRMNSSH